MIGSTIIYISVFLVSVLFSLLYEREIDKELLLNDDVHIGLIRIVRRRFVFSSSFINKIFWGSLVLLPPVLLMTFRSFEVGTDVVSHLDYYNRIRSIPFIEYLKVVDNYDIEIGFQLLCRIAYDIGDNVRFFMFEISFIPIFFIWRGLVYYHIKFGISLPVSLLLYYLLIWPYCMAIVRYGIALSIFFYSYKYIIEHKPIKYIACIILMMMFHSSLIMSVIFYGLYVIINENTGKKSKIITGTAMVGGILLIRPLMFYLYSHTSLLGKYIFYEIDANTSYGMQAYIYPWVFLLPVVLNWNKLVNKNKNWIPILVASMLYLPFSFLMYYNQWFARIVRLPETMFILIFAFLLSQRNEKNMVTYIWKFYIIVFVVVLYLFDGPIGNAFHEFPYMLGL